MSQSEGASIEQSNNKVTIHEECPISVEEILEQIRYLDEPRQCSNWTENNTEDSTWSSEIGKHGALMFQIRAA